MEPAEPNLSLQFGGFSFEPQTGTLIARGKPVLLRPKALAVLTHLAKNIGRVVQKSELMDAAWPGIFVTEDSLTQSIREIRKALNDDEQKLIRTVSKRGYLLVSDAAPPVNQTSHPVVAVLRFRNETGDEGQTPIVDGFAEDIIMGLAKFGTVTVLARHSSFAIGSGGPSDWAAARSRIGATYLVEGSVRRGDRRWQVTVSLIDADKLVQLWSDRYDAEGNAIFDIQRDIAERVIGRLATRLEDAGAKLALHKPETDLAAYELMLRGVAIMRTNNMAEFDHATALLEAAVAKDPAYGLAHAHLAFSMVMRSGFGRSSVEDLNRALKVAARAVSLTPDQSTAHRVLSFVQMYRREYAAAEHHLRRALELNPYDADCINQMGYLLTLRGRPVEALAWLDRAIVLSPIYPEWFDLDRAFALYILGDYRAAASAIELSPIPPIWMRTWLAASYAQMGDMETARAHASLLTQEDREQWAIDFARRNGAAFEHASNSQHFAEGVFMALGVPLE